MLCDSCQHQETCFLPHLAVHDAYSDGLDDRLMTPKASQQIQGLLDKLQVCELYLTRFPQGLSWVNGVNKLRESGRMGLTRATEGVRRLLKGHCLTE